MVAIREEDSTGFQFGGHKGFPVGGSRLKFCYSLGQVIFLQINFFGASLILLGKLNFFVKLIFFGQVNFFGAS